MGERITLELPEGLAHSARTVAQRTQRSVEALPDDQVLALRELQLSAEQQTALSELLARQREGVLTSTERMHLDELLAAYRRGLVRKAQALKVAVERGLQPPLGAG